MGKVSREWLPPLVIIESIGKLSQSIFVSVGFFFKSSFDFLTAWVRAFGFFVSAGSIGRCLYILILVFKANPANKEQDGKINKNMAGGRKIDKKNSLSDMKPEHYFLEL